MTRPGGELTSYRVRGGHANHQANPTRSHCSVNAAYSSFQLNHMYNFLWKIGQSNISKIYHDDVSNILNVYAYQSYLLWFSLFIDKLSICIQMIYWKKEIFSKNEKIYGEISI